MKSLVIIALILSGLCTWAQETATLDEYPVNISLNEVNQEYYAPETNGLLKSGSKGCDIQVTYTNFSEEAKVAFEYAVSIWEANIVSSMPIHLHVKMEALSSNILGYGKPGLFLRNFKSAPLADVFYPVALAEHINNKTYNKDSEADISCSFNNAKSWYFGTDGNTPDSKYDFVSAVLHEIGHGMGFSGFFKNENGIGQFANSSNSPSVYDYYILNLENQRLADQSQFPCPSVELTQQLTSNSLVINYQAENEETGSAVVYAPSTWTNGVSIYHLTKAKTNDPAELMGAYSYKGEAKHNLGINTLKVLAEIGWTEKSAEGDNSVFTAADDELLADAAVRVYPNPCNSVLNVSFPVTNSNSQVTLEVISLTGKVVYSEKWSDTSFNTEKQINLSALESGIYMVQTTDERAGKYTNKIIKN